MQSQFSQSKLVWKAKDPARCRVEAFRRFVNRKHGLSLRDYHDLHKYSVTDWAFWQDLWEYLGIVYSVPPEKILAEGRMKEVPVWFPGARLNYAENILRFNNDNIAVTSARETGQIAHYSFKQLRSMVQTLAAAMRINGLQAGDRVAGELEIEIKRILRISTIITNSIDAVVIALATISVGAIYSSTATDMGTQGVLDRYRQIGPKFVFAETEIVYAGKTIDLMPKVTQVLEDLQNHGLQRAILLPSTKSGREATIPSRLRNA
ncbi:hypothetical protein EIP86_005118 [Pleurotus ostreatoroseus]|nr:hypothetical protein EIP86_005118 [Pleurotus ostreatoroseus]